LSKDNIDTVNLTTTANNNDLNTNNDLPNNDHKATTEISDISDDVSVMSEIIIDELDNPTFSTVTPSEKPKPKPTRGRKKKN
jgi:hypothetical protein